MDMNSFMLFLLIQLSGVQVGYSDVISLYYIVHSKGGYLHHANRPLHIGERQGHHSEMDLDNESFNKQASQEARERLDEMERKRRKIR